MDCASEATVIFRHLHLGAGPLGWIFAPRMNTISYQVLGVRTVFVTTSLSLLLLTLPIMV